MPELKPPPSITRNGVWWDCVERSEVQSLRALVARARELAGKIRDGRREIKKLKNEQCDAETGEKYMRLEMVLKSVKFDTADAEKELLALFAGETQTNAPSSAPSSPVALPRPGAPLLALRSSDGQGRAVRAGEGTVEA